MIHPKVNLKGPLPYAVVKTDGASLRGISQHVIRLRAVARLRALRRHIGALGRDPSVYQLARRLADGTLQLLGDGT